MKTHHTYFIREGNRSKSLQSPSIHLAVEFISIKYPNYLDTIAGHIFLICP